MIFLFSEISRICNLVRFLRELSVAREFETLKVCEQ